MTYLRVEYVTTDWTLPDKKTSGAAALLSGQGSKQFGPTSRRFCIFVLRYPSKVVLVKFRKSCLV